MDSNQEISSTTTKARLSLRGKFKFANLFTGVVLHSALTVSALGLVILMWGNSARNAGTAQEEALLILRNIRQELHHGDAADRMQSFFPEGACFLNTLYGLAWANLAGQPAWRDEALTEIRAALDGQETPVALEPFRWDTTVRRGMFWVGQRNLLLARYLALQPKQDADVTSLTREFHDNARDIHKAIMESPTHQVESYQGMCWPADAPAGLVSLVYHDKAYVTTYTEALEMWKEYHNTHGWNGTGLPAGRIDHRSGHQIEPARGCATSLMIALLAEADPAYAAALYKDYQKHFQISRCGFSMFREYPLFHIAVPDVDSGPIIWGAGVTATGVGLAASRAAGDLAMAQNIHQLSNVFGFPGRITTSSGEPAQRYLRGVLPIGDAFLAWGLSVPLPEAPLADFAPPPAQRWVFHTIVAGVIGLLLLQWLLIARRQAKLIRNVKTMDTTTST